MADLINESQATDVQAKEDLDILPNDEELNSKITQWLTESQSVYDTLKKIQKKSQEYYLGNQTKRDLIPAHLSNYVQNRIFESVETVLPIVTSRPAEFIVKSPDVSELGESKAKKIQTYLGHGYDRVLLPQKLEDASRHAFLFRFGVLYIFWNQNIDDWDVECIRPQRVIIPRYGGRYGSIFTIVKRDMNFQELKEFFGEDTARDLSLMSKTGDSEDGEEATNKRVWTIQEVWTDYWRAFRYQNKILKKEMNPYFDFKDASRNFHKQPRQPFFLIAPFNLGESMIPDTSLVEQAIPIQDALNAVGRIIINHATKTANSPWLIDNATMTKEEADQIRNESGLIIYGKDVANPGMVRRDTPPSMPNYIFELHVDLNRGFDNLFGLHSTTRGEREGKETFRGRVLLKQADIGRLDYVVREIDRTVRGIGDYALQMIKLFYTESRKIKSLGSPDGADVFEIGSADVEEGMEVMVKSGSTLPKDEVTRGDQSIQLWQLGAIDPITLFESLQYPDPLKTAERLMKWKIAPQTLIPIEGTAPAPAAPAVPAIQGLEGVEPGLIPQLGGQQ